MARDHEKDVTARYLPRTLIQRWADNPQQLPIWGQWLQGSLMHCDVTGFTAMSETLAEAGNEGAELMAAILNRFFERMLHLADQWGGVQMKFGGDAMLLYFPGEEHAVRAAACGLEMQVAMRDFRKVTVLDDVHQLRMRIGIHSGRFFSASVGQVEGLLHYLLVGKDVNLTADVEPLAEPGQVVISTATADLLNDQCRWVATSHQGIWRVQRAALPADVDMPVYDFTAAPRSILLRYLMPPIAAGKNIGLAGEHRRATIVFIYLEGLSELLEKDGDREALEQADAFVNLLLLTVQKHGGFLAASDASEHGDKLIVLFGAPVSLDQQETSALRFACELQDKLKDCGLQLNQQIGINTGFVFAGEIGSQRRREYTVIGDSVNLSARLMAAAGAGNILVSAVTAERAGDGFELQRLDPIKVKGKSRPIDIYRVEGVRKQHLTLFGEDSQVQFVGRLVEMKKLSSLARRVRQGKGALVYIHGEPGIGKTRLSAELAISLLDDGWRNLIGICPAYNSRIAYSAWVEPLRALFGIQVSDTHEQAWEKLRKGVETLCPDLVVFAPLVAEVLSLPAKENPVIRSLDAKTRRDRRMSTITSIIGAFTKQQPVFLLFDDVHWIDASSAELIAQVSEHPGLRLFICLTSRHEALPDGLSTARPDHALQLKELSPPASREMVQQLSDTSSENVDTIVARARGNPLFLKELSQSGASSKDDLPETIYDVIMVRLDRLRNDDKSILQHAAVIGSTFDINSLRSLMVSERRPISGEG